MDQLWRMSRLTRDGTAEPVSRDQIFRHERRHGKYSFSYSVDHVQDWQPYPVDPYSCYMCDHRATYPSFYYSTSKETYQTSLFLQNTCATTAVVPQIAPYIPSPSSSGGDCSSPGTQSGCGVPTRIMSSNGIPPVDSAALQALVRYRRVAIEKQQIPTPRAAQGQIIQGALVRCALSETLFPV